MDRKGAKVCGRRILQTDRIIDQEGTVMHANTNPRLGFQIHAFAFVVGILGMVALNVILGEPYWVIWPLLGWSVGLIAHWWFVLGPGARTGS